MAPHDPDFMHNPNCHHLKIKGELGNVDIDLTVCDCLGMATTTDAITLLKRLAQRMTNLEDFDEKNIRLSTTGFTGSQSLRDLHPDQRLSHCLPMGSTINFHFM
jgi:hypothetical protein